ncbi:hypothetical protein M9458_025788 [Cirrhinus mrigala]|uniref:RNase H type-1 domain-containing protein n=1 Tax=Cirrhinus mrigala TaxID=683832 RepID=A0ABD0Q675_CIRMR
MKPARMRKKEGGVSGYISGHFPLRLYIFATGLQPSLYNQARHDQASSADQDRFLLGCLHCFLLPSASAAAVVSLECISRLSAAHTEAALTETECPHWEDMSLASLRLRIAFFSECGSAPHALPLSSSQQPVRKKQRGRGARRSVPSELTPTETSHASFSPSKGDSPIFFSHPDQRPSAAAIDLVSFGGSESDAMDNSLSLAACDVEGLLGSSHDPAPTPSAEMSSATSSGMDAELFRILGPCLRSLDEWPLVNEPRHSSLRSMMRSPSHGVPPTMPACVPPFSPPSPLPMVPMGYDKLPPLDESPTDVGRLQPSLDEPIRRLDRRLWRFTLWRSYRSTRPNSITHHQDVLRHHETAVQNAYTEADPLASSPRGLVLFAGSERCLISHPDCPPPQAILEIRLQESGISVHKPSFWTIPCSPHFYKVQKGIHILNYLDEWLILAQSEDELLSHRSFLLSHLDCLGLRVNFAKSALPPSQWISFLGTVLDSTLMRAVVMPEHALAIQQLAASFKIGASKGFSEDAGSHGLCVSNASAGPASIAAPSESREFHPMPGITDAFLSRDHQWMEWGIPLDIVCRKKVVSTDASNSSWGALCDGKLAFGYWSKRESRLYINCLEMLAVYLGLHSFLPDLRGHHILVRSDSMMVVSYINHQFGLSLKHLFILVGRLVEWAQLNLRSLRAKHVPGRLNQGADMLSRRNVPLEEWMLHPQMVQRIWEIFGKAEVNLFASEDNTHCPTYFLKNKDALAHEWPDLLLYTQSQGSETQGAVSGPLLEEQTLVCRTISAALSSTVAHPPEMGPPLSGEQNNMAPSARVVGSTPVVSRRPNPPRPITVPSWYLPIALRSSKTSHEMQP